MQNIGDRVYPKGFIYTCNTKHDQAVIPGDLTSLTKSLIVTYSQNLVCNMSSQSHVLLHNIFRSKEKYVGILTQLFGQVQIFHTSFNIKFLCNL